MLMLLIQGFPEAKKSRCMGGEFLHGKKSLILFLKNHREYLNTNKKLPLIQKELKMY